MIIRKGEKRYDLERSILRSCLYGFVQPLFRKKEKSLTADFNETIKPVVKFRLKNSKTFSYLSIGVVLLTERFCLTLDKDVPFNQFLRSFSNDSASIVDNGLPIFADDFPVDQTIRESCCQASGSLVCCIILKHRRIKNI